MSSNPDVTAMAACLGSRPVAKALGAGHGHARGDGDVLDHVPQPRILLALNLNRAGEQEGLRPGSKVLNDDVKNGADHDEKE